VESLFSRLRAKARLCGNDFDRQLMALTPLQVYAGCIESLWGLYSRSPLLAAMFPELSHLVHREREWLATQPNTATLSLEQLVAHVDASMPTV
jgi:hypothetical protein